MKTNTFTAGVKIKIGQVLYGRMVDEDTSEPLLLVFPIQPGENPIGVAMSNADEWEQVTVATSGHITSITAIAGENIKPGLVYIGDDGKAYQSHTKQEQIIRYVIAGADLKKGQRLVFDHSVKGYVPAAEGFMAEGVTPIDAKRGQIFGMIVAFYDPKTGTLTDTNQLPEDE